MTDPSIDNADDDSRTSYTCPDELYSIPRGIHLARLAAFYPKCQECEHRFDAGHLFPREDRRKELPPRPVIRSSIVTDEGVRAVYLNELDRNRAIVWGEALAALLWDQQPLIARARTVDQAQIILERPAAAPQPKGLNVVVGFDERPSSPDIITGVVMGLRRMGCSVIDLGSTALPVLAFHVNELGAAAGLMVTGAGGNPSTTGLELLTSKARPFSRSTLLELEQAVKTGVVRQTRQIGGHQPVQGQASYESSLQDQFHALRPLRIACGSSTRWLPRTLDRLFARLPCSLTFVELPSRQRNLFDARDVDLHRVATTVMQSKCHLGLIVDEDGRHCAFVTDRGRLVAARELARLLIEIALRERPFSTFVVATSLRADVAGWLSGREATIVDGGETTVGLLEMLEQQKAVIAISADGRAWYRHAYPVCDALIVLSQVLKMLSLSDALFSEVVARISGEAN